MISSLRDTEPKALADDNQSVSVQEPVTQTVEEEHRPPVLGVVIAFIVLFWGALGLGLIFWPR